MIIYWVVYNIAVVTIKLVLYISHHTIVTNVITAQYSTVRPIRHTRLGMKSGNGSLRDAGCTSVNGDDICNLRDGGTSVLVDNTILPLSGLNGDQWARDLYTVKRGSTTFISIGFGFDFGTLVEVRRVELVLFNCQKWSIFASEIYIYTSTTGFPRSDTASPRDVVGERVLPNSCENLNRFVYF